MLSGDQILTLILVLHGRVRVQGMPLARLLLLGVQYLDAVGKLARSLVLMELLHLCLCKLLLALRDGVMLLLGLRHIPVCTIGLRSHASLTNQRPTKMENK